MMDLMICGLYIVDTAIIDINTWPNVSNYLSGMLLMLMHLIFVILETGPNMMYTLRNVIIINERDIRKTGINFAHVKQVPVEHLTATENRTQIASVTVHHAPMYPQL